MASSTINTAPDVRSIATPRGEASDASMVAPALRPTTTCGSPAGIHVIGSKRRRNRSLLVSREYHKATPACWPLTARAAKSADDHAVGEVEKPQSPASTAKSAVASSYIKTQDALGVMPVNVSLEPRVSLSLADWDSVRATTTRAAPVAASSTAARPPAGTNQLSFSIAQCWATAKSTSEAEVTRRAPTAGAQLPAAASTRHTLAPTTAYNGMLKSVEEDVAPRTNGSANAKGAPESKSAIAASSMSALCPPLLVELNSVAIGAHGCCSAHVPAASSATSVILNALMEELPISETYRQLSLTAMLAGCAKLTNFASVPSGAPAASNVAGEAPSVVNVDGCTGPASAPNARIDEACGPSSSRR